MDLIFSKIKFRYKNRQGGENRNLIFLPLFPLINGPRLHFSIGWLFFANEKQIKVPGTD